MEENTKIFLAKKIKYNSILLVISIIISVLSYLCFVKFQTCWHIDFDPDMPKFCYFYFYGISINEDSYARISIFIGLLAFLSPYITKGIIKSVNYLISLIKWVNKYSKMRE